MDNLNSAEQAVQLYINWSLAQKLNNTKKGSVKAQLHPILEVIIRTQKVVLVSMIMLVSILQKPDLIKALIGKMFAIFYNLNTHTHSCVQIMCLDGFAERSRTQIFRYMRMASNDRTGNMEIFVVFNFYVIINFSSTGPYGYYILQ
jgi:hypothetical protein